jgi:hypothetical protein
MALASSCSYDYGKLRAQSDGQAGAAGGQGGIAGGQASGGRTGGAGRGGAGGRAGGGGDLGKHDAGCSSTDARTDQRRSCTALFNFESGAQGAQLGTDQQAFTHLAVSPANTFCGDGALAVTAAFSGTTGLTTKGDIELPLGVDGGAVPLAGRTLTIHAAATGTCGTDLKMTVVVVTAAGDLFPLRNVPIMSSWTTSVAVLPSDAGTGINGVVAVTIDFSSFTGYAATIYVDEIDVR